MPRAAVSLIRDGDILLFECHVKLTRLFSIRWDVGHGDTAAAQRRFYYRILNFRSASHFRTGAIAIFNSLD